MTRDELAKLTDTHEQSMILSVYIARESDDPGMGEVWKRRLTSALDHLQTDLEGRAPKEVPGFERAVAAVLSALEGYGRVLPHEGWCAFATEEGLAHAADLPYRPIETARWRRGPFVSPYVRALKSNRPVALAVTDRWHAQIFRFQGEELSEPLELAVDRTLSDVSDIGVSKRAGAASGVRGATATDFAQRSQAEEAKRLRTRVVSTAADMCGDDGGVVVGGTREAAGAVRKELEETLEGRIIEVPELSFDTPRSALVEHAKGAASRLTEHRQSRFIESCGDPRWGSTGWNETYRALGAGAVDTLLVARALVTDSPEDAERLVRLALAQGAEVEEVGGEIGDRLSAECEGIAARLRFVPASLQS
jgi:hypothetical protein